jgi:hypothetical protein
MEPTQYQRKQIIIRIRHYFGISLGHYVMSEQTHTIRTRNRPSLSLSTATTLKM